ncbi:MAG: hypothetical protein H0W64_09410 [Gammaproteobacteria bacterium]|nr:hypothetical protein [Gammaproteobacteria bacterium]
MQRLFQAKKNNHKLPLSQPKLISKPKPHSFRDNWKLFKKIEKNYILPQRIKSTYRDNLTAAITLPSSNRELNKQYTNYEKLLKLSEANIIEHAARRVDLFFYTLVAYYQQHCPPIQGLTKLQHGIGRVNFKGHQPMTHAAHSSFITSTVDRTILKEILLFSSLEKTQTTIQTSLLDRSHFMDSLNATVEVPVFINEFDYLLEVQHQGRNASFKILREVAKGKIDPIQGLTNFIMMLNEVFTSMGQNENIFEIQTPLTKEIKQSVVALQRYGTLINKLDVESNSVRKEYIYMLLRLTPDEITRCDADVKMRQKILMDKMFEMQNEIMTKPSAHMQVDKRQFYRSY